MTTQRMSFPKHDDMYRVYAAKFPLCFHKAPLSLGFGEKPIYSLEHSGDIDIFFKCASGCCGAEGF